jgi:hypothetical protein
MIPFGWKIIRGIQRVIYREGPAAAPLPGPLGWNVVRGIPRVIFGRGFPSSGSESKPPPPPPPPPSTATPLGWNAVRRAPRIIWVRGLLSSPSGSTLEPGVITILSIGRHSITLSATDATGGVQPYRYQWQYSSPRDSIPWTNAAGQGTTTLMAVIESLGLNSSYEIRLQYTDSASAVVYSEVSLVSTRSLRWFRGLNRLYR